MLVDIQGDMEGVQSAMQDHTQFSRPVGSLNRVLVILRCHRHSSR